MEKEKPQLETHSLHAVLPCTQPLPRCYFVMLSRPF
jgi:hypothetical protein